MKHLLIIDQSDFINMPVGGSTTFLRTVVPQLSEYFDVSLLGRTSQPDLVGKWTVDYLGKARFFGFGRIGGKSRFIPCRIKTLSQLWQAKCFVKDLMPDILYFHQTETALPFVQFHSCRKALHIHGLANPLSVSRFPILRTRTCQEIYNSIFRLVERSVDLILSVSQPEPSDSNELPLSKGRPFHYIPVCINGTLFAPADKIEARRKLGLPPSAEIVGFVGRLSRKKNLEITLQALRHLADRGRFVHFLIVGEGEHENALKKMTLELGLFQQVLFVPAQSYTHLPDYYNAMDMFVMTSLAEGFPMVVLEALASGTPVVANVVGAIPDIIRDGINGCLLTSLEPGAVATAIDSVLNQRQALSNAARKSSEPYFADKIARRLAQVIGA